MIALALSLSANLLLGWMTYVRGVALRLAGAIIETLAKELENEKSRSQEPGEVQQT